jgi:transposase
MPAKYVRPYAKGQKSDFRDGKTIPEAVQRSAMKFVATKTAEQLDLQALHRVRQRLVSQRTSIINQIRAFLLERGVAVRQGPRFLRTELPNILAERSDPAEADKRTRSKWSRAMRYVAAYKPDSEPLDHFIRRKGGINACAARFALRLGRGPRCGK